jgi:hypothetical protein
MPGFPGGPFLPIGPLRWIGMRATIAQAVGQPALTESDIKVVVVPEFAEEVAAEAIVPKDPALREEVARLGAYGWTVAFVDEPDQTRSWFVLNMDGSTILQQGRTSPGEDWQDAVLDAVSNLYPPSPEGRAGY